MIRSCIQRLPWTQLAVLLLVLPGGAPGWGQSEDGHNRAALKPVLKGDTAPAQLRPIIRSELPANSKPVELSPQKREPEVKETPEKSDQPSDTNQSKRKTEPSRTAERKPAASELEPLLRMPPSLAARQGLRNYLIRNRGADEAPRAMLRIAQISEELKEPVEARAMYEGVLAANSTSAQKQTARTALARLAGSGAATVGTESAKSVPPPTSTVSASSLPTTTTTPVVVPVAPEEGLQVARHALEQGQYEAAEQAFRAAINSANTNPGDPAQQRIRQEALLGLGLVAELKGQLETARQNYELAQQADPAGPAALLASQRLADLTRPLIQ